MSSKGGFRHLEGHVMAFAGRNVTNVPAANAAPCSGDS